jgi:hypothetical protein
VHSTEPFSYSVFDKKKTEIEDGYILSGHLDKLLPFRKKIKSLLERL